MEFIALELFFIGVTISPTRYIYQSGSRLQQKTTILTIYFVIVMVMEIHRIQPKYLQSYFWR